MQITDNIPGHRDRQRERATETRIERRTYTRIISYNIAEQWEKLPIIYPYTDTNREKCTCTLSQREKVRHIRTLERTFRAKERERQKYKSKDVRIHAALIIIKHTFSEALLHTDPAERPCSHTCILPIIYPGTERDRGIKRYDENVE